MTTQAIARKLKHNLEKSLPHLIDRVILYGSHVRSESHKNSDIDILLILKEDIDLLTKEKIYNECSDLNVDCDVFIDISILSLSDMQTIRGRQPFVQNALAEGVIV